MADETAPSRRLLESGWFWSGFLGALAAPVLVYGAFSASQSIQQRSALNEYPMVANEDYMEAGEQLASDAQRILSGQEPGFAVSTGGVRGLPCGGARETGEAERWTLQAYADYGEEQRARLDSDAEAFLNDFAAAGWAVEDPTPSDRPDTDPIADLRLTQGSKELLLHASAVERPSGSLRLRFSTPR